MRTNETKVISFSGIDGAGKSTQIEALQSYLQKHGFKFAFYTFWDDVVALPRVREFISHKAFKGDKGVGSPDRPITRRDKNITSWYTFAARLVFYLLDTLSLRFALGKFRQPKLDFIIFDRYIYDELANLPFEHWLVRLYVRFLLGLSPTPDVAFVVDADPEAACLRKPEYPLEFLRKNRNAYIALSRLVPGMQVIDPGSIEETTARIVQSISNRLRKDLIRCERATTGAESPY